MVYDYIIIGGGIVGSSTAWQLQKRMPGKKILLVEKEDAAATHQTGRNSGVIHAGVYYPPGSLKARFCKAGAAATISFCQQHGIKYEQCGKLLVAVDDDELRRMHDLLERCRQNGLDPVLLTAGQLREREPNITGRGAIFIPSTGIVDYRQVTLKMLDVFRRDGGRVSTGCEVTGIQEGDQEVVVSLAMDGREEKVSCTSLIACAGLMADRIARMMNIQADFSIIPYRGEYFRLGKPHNTLINHLIYPIPDPDLPFLGVHLTRMTDGFVTVGPNAVQGWKREGYGKINIDLQDTFELLRFPGFWRVTAKHFRHGVRETINSLWKRGYLSQVQKYCPSLKMSDLQPHPVGIRAQAVTRDGQLIHDFLFGRSRRSLHVCNAPSPAATSAIPIGAYICDQLANHRA